MIAVDIFVASLKCAWIKRLQTNSAADRIWVLGSTISLNIHIDNLSWYGASMLKIKSLANKIGNKFWADVVRAWARFVENYEHKPEV